MNRTELAALNTTRGVLSAMLALSLFGVAVGLLVALVHGPDWTATTSVLLRVAAPETLALTGSADPASVNDQVDASSLATSQDVLAAAQAKLNLAGGLPQLQREVSAGAQGSSHIVVISATESDPVAAQHVADVVADAFVTLTRRQLTDMAAALAPAAGPPPAAVDPGAQTQGPGAQTQDPGVLARAQLLSTAIQPLLVFHQLPASKPSWLLIPAALGIVGLGAGALAAVAATLLRRRVDRAGDAQRLLSLPAVNYDRTAGGAAAERLVRGLLRERGRRELLVCPVDVDAELAAVRFVGWLRQQESDSGVPEIRLVPEPALAVLGVRPSKEQTSGLLVVIPRGTPHQVVTEAAALLATWQPVDAVVVAT